MMDINVLKKLVVEANKELPKQQLVKFSWGNVSAIDREKNIIVIKPVGMPYDELSVDNVSVTDLDGNKLEGEINPSVDLDIHRALYLNFPEVNAVVHTHSTYATVMAQLCRPIPRFGGTHADYFAGDIPCIERLPQEEMDKDYEWHAGLSIVKHYKENKLSPKDLPAVLLMNHGPFTWGGDVWDAVHKAVVLEEISKMAVHMLSIDPNAKPMPDAMADTHYYRKHGANAYFKTDDYGKGLVERES